uniref:Peptidase_M28 domain-containing protein n=1 Tax=Echinococcus granulosus TaxID=6210 RepID=A0A068X4U5_ECHGR|nr:hypothetical protein EgrG_002055100 [Echinococcus granulosus]
MTCESFVVNKCSKSSRLPQTVHILPTPHPPPQFYPFHTALHVFAPTAATRALNHLHLPRLLPCDFVAFLSSQFSSDTSSSSTSFSILPFSSFIKQHFALLPLFPLSASLFLALITPLLPTRIHQEFLLFHSLCQRLLPFLPLLRNKLTISFDCQWVDVNETVKPPGCGEFVKFRECDAAKTVTDVLSLYQQDSAASSLLMLYGHHDRQAEIDDDYRNVATSFCCRSTSTYHFTRSLLLNPIYCWFDLN